MSLEDTDPDRANGTGSIPGVDGVDNGNTGAGDGNGKRERRESEVEE